MSKEPNYTNRNSLRLRVDMAGMGRGSSMFLPSLWNYVKQFLALQSSCKANHMEIAGITKNILEGQTDSFTDKLAQAFIATIGEGAGVYSRLQEQGITGVYSVEGSNKPEWEGRPLHDHTGEYQFLNMRPYLYWMLRDWLNPVLKNNPALPPDEELLQELTKTKWKFRSDAKIQIESKEELKSRIKRSPDKADALANTFYPVPDFSIAAQREKAKMLEWLAFNLG